MNPAPASPTGGQTPRSLADVTDHMTARFHGRIGLSTIVRVVRHCRRELAVTHNRVSLSAVEHLATRRLTDLVERH